MNILRSRASARLVADGGFTIMESVVALVIIFGLILVMVRTFDTSTDVLVQSNRRSAANALASELLERSRSLEWEHMGLTANANGSACPDDVACASHPPSVSSEVTVNANGNYAFDGEEIVFANGDTFDPFLSFNDQVTRDDVVYERYLFVTSVRDDPLDPATERLRRITAIVRWQAPNGFPEEIRMATLVAEFIEPSQPFMTGEVAFDGGTVNLRGSESRCASDPQCGAFVEGTSDLAAGLPREDLQLDLYFPDLLLSATTDYVSQGSYRGSSSTADIRWAGPDGLVTTADDIFTQILPVEEETYVDDDASSLPVLNEPRTVAVDLLPLFQSSAAPPYDVVLADLDRVGDLNLSVNPDLEYATVDGEAWIRHDIDPGPAVDDGLPYTASELGSSDTTRVGFREYEDPAARAAYEIWLAAPLDDPVYEFTFARMGDTTNVDALAFDGHVDRLDDASDNRQVHADFDWSGEKLHLFDDTVIPKQPGSTDFEGWVRVTLPALSATTPFQAGESAAFPPATTITGDLIVEFWNAPDKRYDTAFSGFAGMECAASSTTVSFTSVIGGPQSLSLSLPDEPRVTYEVDAEVTIRPFCPSHTLDPNGDVAQADVSFAQMVTGTVSYKVTDDLMALFLGDGLLYDLALDFDAGGVDTTVIFVNPEA